MNEGYMHKEIIHDNKTLNVSKSIIAPSYNSRTILTDSVWEYVTSFYKQVNSINAKDALFYWQQAKSFYDASMSLNYTAKPLTNYYCILNATKSMLKFKGIDEKDLSSHGVSGVHNKGYTSLNNEIIKIKGGGVLFQLKRYLECNDEFDDLKLKDVLYNITYIHRAFCITYKLKQNKELFIPIYRYRFVRKSNNKESWFEFSLENKYDNSQTLGDIGNDIEKDISYKDRNVYRFKKRFEWDAKKPESQRIKKISSYNKYVRERVYYIYSNQYLWYIKKKENIDNIISLPSPILTFIAMHKLSEICRYQPKVFDKHLSSKSSWLLIEFINKGLLQFIDEIAAEITNNDIMPTGIRS